MASPNEKPLPPAPSHLSVHDPKIPVKVDAALADEEEPEMVDAHEHAQPTQSHVLANADHEEKGAAQMEHNQTEVMDLGWNQEPHEMPKMLVGGLSNEELWTLIRRFNKVCLTAFFFLRRAQEWNLENGGD